MFRFRDTTDADIFRLSLDDIFFIQAGINMLNLGPLRVISCSTELLNCEFSINSSH